MTLLEQHQTTRRLTNELKKWLGAKYKPEHQDWAIRRYSLLLGLPPTPVLSDEPEAVLQRFFDFDQADENTLAGGFPRRGTRSDIVSQAKAKLEYTRRKCFEWDYEALAWREKLKFGGKERYWARRDEIISKEFEQAQEYWRTHTFIEPLSLEQFTKIYYAELAHTFVGSQVMNSRQLSILRRYNSQGYRTYFRDHGYNSYNGILKPIVEGPPNTLLVHSLEKDALQLALASGRLGENGFGRACFTENRISYPRGYALVFRLDELSQVYPMFPFNEDPHDAHLLHEWRSPYAVDVDLAVALLPTREEYVGDIPKQGGPWGTMVFGEAVLREIGEATSHLL